MITPTIGRKVWYYPESNLQELTKHDEQPFDATIVYVWSDSMVNLLVVDHQGNVAPRTSVHLSQDGGAARGGGEQYCAWMPYQKAVAKGEIAATLHVDPKA